jgi:hypothetical protein
MNNENEEFANIAADYKDKIQSADVYAGMVTKNFLGDPWVALQLGYALLMEKPIILLVDKDVEIPKAVVRVANLIQRIDTKDPNWTTDASQAISQFAKGVR